MDIKIGSIYRIIDESCNVDCIIKVKGITNQQSFVTGAFYYNVNIISGRIGLWFRKSDLSAEWCLAHPTIKLIEI